MDRQIPIAPTDSEVWGSSKSRPGSADHRVSKPRMRLALILFLAALARGYAFDRPWAPGDHNGFGGAFYSNVARNHIRYGYLETRFAPVVNTGQTPRDRWRYYLTHPPFIGIAVSLSFRVFGEHEWSARLIPLIFSVGSVALIHLVGTRLWGATVGWVAALFAAFVPVGVIYGAHVEDQGPAVVFFALALFEGYRRGSRWLMWTALVLGAGFDWPIHCMVGALTLYAVLTGRLRRGSVWVLPLLSLALVVGFALYAQTIAPRQEQSYIGVRLLDSFFFWTGHEVDPQHFLGYPVREPSLAEWLPRMGEYCGELLTLPLIVLASIGLGVSLSRRNGAPLLILLLWGVPYIAVFRMAAFVHDFFLDLLAPGLVLAAAIGAVGAAEKISPLLRIQTARRAAATLALLGLTVYWLSIGIGRIESSRRQRATLGKRLNRISQPDEGILSLYPFDMRDAYYADRPVRQGVNRVRLFEEAMSDPDFRYRYFVVPRSLVELRPAKPLFRILETQYRRTQFEGFYIYDVGSRAILEPSQDAAGS